MDQPDMRQACSTVEGTITVGKKYWVHYEFGASFLIFDEQLMPGDLRSEVRVRIRQTATW